MNISEAARRTGVTPHALRHYEALGLIRAARRPSGYRAYDASVVRDVAFIVAGRRLGFSLRQLGEALPAYRSGRLTPALGIDALNDLIADLDRRIAALQTQRSQLLVHVERLSAPPKVPTPAWPGVKPRKEHR